VVIPGTEMRVSAKRPSFPPNDQGHFGVGLEVDHSVYDANPCRLHFACLSNIRFFVETRLQLDQRGHVFPGLRGFDQVSYDGRVVACPVQSLFDRNDIRVTGRDHLLREGVIDVEALPPSETGLECIVLVDGGYVATFRFHDAPRDESAPFVAHLGPKHGVDRILLVSGDREAEVRYLANQVAIDEIHAGVSPEGKVEIVRLETAQAKTLFLGDGINDAPAMLTATVGIAFGGGDITSEAASAVIVDPSLGRVDELLHISQSMRKIALQSAVGGMALSVVGMLIAAAGYLPPVAGAVAQEVIDLVAVFNALRVAAPSRTLTDF
jgi:cation transport ATPase